MNLNRFFTSIALFFMVMCSYIAVAQDTDDTESDAPQTDIYFNIGLTNTAIRDKVISTFVYEGNGIAIETGVSHRNDFIRYDMNFDIQAVNPSTEMRKGFKYDNDFIKDTVNGISGNEVKMMMIDFGGDLLFKINRNSESKMTVWIGARFNYLNMSKKFLTLDHQNLSNESYTTLSPMGVLEFQPHSRHRIYYSLDISLVGYASKELFSNLKPDYSKTERYISLYKESGGYGFNNLLLVNSGLGYSFLVARHIALTAKYSFIYNRYAVPLEVRMVRQNFVVGLSVVF